MKQVLINLSDYDFYDFVAVNVHEKLLQLVVDNFDVLVSGKNIKNYPHVRAEKLSVLFKSLKPPQYKKPTLKEAEIVFNECPNHYQERCEKSCSFSFFHICSACDSKDVKEIYDKMKINYQDGIVKYKEWEEKYKLILHYEKEKN